MVKDAEKFKRQLIAIISHDDSCQCEDCVWSRGYNVFRGDNVVRARCSICGRLLASDDDCSHIVLWESDKSG